MKKEMGLGPCIFSSSPEEVVPVRLLLPLFLVLLPKRPGKKPDPALRLSIIDVSACGSQERKEAALRLSRQARVDDEAEDSGTPSGCRKECP